MLIHDLVGPAVVIPLCSGVHNFVYSVSDCNCGIVVTLYKFVSVQVVVYKIVKFACTLLKKKRKSKDSTRSCQRRCAISVSYNFIEEQ